MSQDPFAWGGPLDAPGDTFERIREDIRAIQQSRARPTVHVVSPATYANLLDIAAREGIPFDKPAVRAARTHGAVASWVLGRFAPKAPDTWPGFFIKGRSGLATYADGLDLIEAARWFGPAQVTPV
jgi:hypothetical protein